MKQFHNSNGALFPVSCLYHEIELRLCRLSIKVPLERLRHHVWRQYLADDPRQAAELPYFQTYMAKNTSLRAPAARCPGDFVMQGLDVLEMAILVCEKARSDSPKPLRALLDEALHLCKQFDMLEALHEERRRACVAARVRGGIARQSKLDPARRRAARLILVKAPPTGWDNPAQAARGIEPYLTAFIAQRRLGMWGSRRTIVRWINSHPLVRCAYDKRRRPPAP